MKLQFNKGFLKKVQDDLVVRSKLIPVLKTKELALRQEISLSKSLLTKVQNDLEEAKKNLKEDLKYLTAEDINNLSINFDVQIENIKKSGVIIQVLKNVELQWVGIDLLYWPAWYTSFIPKLIGIETLKQKILLNETEIKELNKERRKTTCRINLYEKVQIPNLRDAELKIKRYLEDIENLEKSSLKLLKKKLEAS